jgi:hypothetical protein
MTNGNEVLKDVEIMLKGVIDYFFKRMDEEQFNEFDRSRNLLEETLGKEHSVKPVGFDLMIQIYKRPTTGKVLLPDQIRDTDKFNNRVARVLAMGPEAYLRKSKFPKGPWCQIGDWLIVRPYEMSQFGIKVKDDVRILHEDLIDIEGNKFDLANVFDDKIRNIVAYPELIDTSDVVGR